MRIQLDAPRVIEWIGYNQICQNARFVFDQPIKVEIEDILELTNGGWWLISQGVRIPMHGRWDR